MYVELIGYASLKQKKSRIFRPGRKRPVFFNFPKVSNFRELSSFEGKRVHHLIGGGKEGIVGSLCSGER